MVMIGFILLIVPGIVLALTSAYFGYAIVDHPSDGPIAGLRRSAQITKGQRWHLLGLGLVLILLNITGFLVLMVGVLVTGGSARSHGPTSTASSTPRPPPMSR